MVGGKFACVQPPGPASPARSGIPEPAGPSVELARVPGIECPSRLGCLETNALAALLERGDREKGGTGWVPFDATHAPTFPGSDPNPPINIHALGLPKTVLSMTLA